MTSISIITAVYNRQATIADAIRSVQVQSWVNVEHVIQDGGSTDGTLDVVRDMMNGATSLVSERDSGIYDAINRGIARSTGDVVGLIHSDDYYASRDILEKVAAAFADPAVDAVYGDVQYVSARDDRRIVRHWRSGRCTAAQLALGWMPPHPTLFVRRAVFERWGLYDTGFRIAADYDAMLRWIVKGRIRLAYIPEVFVKMRTGGESNRSIERMWCKSREDYIAIRRNGVGGLPTLVAKNLRKIPQFFVGSGREGRPPS